VTHPQVRPDPAFGLLKLYDDALPHVYGYLLARCGFDAFDLDAGEDPQAARAQLERYSVAYQGAADTLVHPRRREEFAA